MKGLSKMKRINCKMIAVACLFATTGCHRATDSWAVTDVNIAFPPITGAERPTERAGSPAELLEIYSGGQQTALIHCVISDNPKKTDDERSRAHVIVIDGEPKPGTYEVSPANGRLVQNSAWRPARKPYGGLEGEITIVKIKGNRVIAECSIRNIISRTGDPVYPLRGRYEFEMMPADQVPLDECGIQLK
jgi:hypothetical protein